MNLTSFFKVTKFIEPFLNKNFFFLLFLKSFPFKIILIPKIPYLLSIKVFKKFLKILTINLSPFEIFFNPVHKKKDKKDTFLYQIVYKKLKKYFLFRHEKVLKKECL
jgi:hypothetical protein